jgi:hypothetical protein
MGHVDGEYLANFRNIIGGFTRLDIGSRKDAEALSLVVKSFKTQMAPMATDVPPLATRTINSNCRLRRPVSICVHPFLSALICVEDLRTALGCQFNLSGR